MRFDFRAVMRFFVRLIAWGGGVVLVLFVWFNYADVIVAMMDANLAFIKWTTHVVPPPYGAMAESALRGALAADKALLFFEGGMAVRTFIWLVFSRRMPFTRRTKEARHIVPRG